MNEIVNFFLSPEQLKSDRDFSGSSAGILLNQPQPYLNLPGIA